MSTITQPLPLPPKPTRVQLKHHSRLLDGFLPSSPTKVAIAEFARQSQELSLCSDLPDWTSQLEPGQLGSLARAASLDDLAAPLAPIFKDSNLVSELRDHQHELATPYGSLHALHTLDQHPRTPEGSDDALLVLSDIPVNPTPPHLDPSLSAGSSLQLRKPSTSKPKRIRKKAAGPRVPIEDKPHPIKHLMATLQATGLQMLKQSYDAMHFVKAVGRSDWNTSTQPIFSALSYERVRELHRSLNQSNPVILTITFHPLSRTQTVDRDRATTTNTFTTTCASDSKAISPRQQILHILSIQTLAELKDAVVCAADAIPRYDDDKGLWSDSQRWDAGCCCVLEGVAYPDRRGIGVAGKSDYGVLLKRLIDAMSPNGPKLVDQHQINQQSRLVPPPPQPDHGDIPVVNLAHPSSPKAPVPSTSQHPQPQLILSDKGMEDVRLQDLELHIGEPYWLLHQGNCEHVFTVDSIRALHPTDPVLPQPPSPPPLELESESRCEKTVVEGCYPITTFLSRIASPKCRVCDRDPAKLVVINDELLDESPCFVCEKCFELLHGHDLKDYEKDEDEDEDKDDDDDDELEEDDPVVNQMKEGIRRVELEVEGIRRTGEIVVLQEESTSTSMKKKNKKRMKMSNISSSTSNNIKTNNPPEWWVVPLLGS